MKFPAESVDALLAAAYALDGPDANRVLSYARWAETYDNGFIVDSRYIYHDQVAELFAGHACSTASDPTTSLSTSAAAPDSRVTLYGATATSASTASTYHQRCSSKQHASNTAALSGCIAN